MDGSEWLRDWEKRVAQLGEQARHAQEALRGVTGTANSASGAVTVTVTATGALQGVVFTERAEELSRPKLAEAVLEAARKAQAAVARSSADALRPMLGEAGTERFRTEYTPPVADEPAREPWR
jgi:DNA-binding protein YbaB